MRRLAPLAAVVLLLVAGAARAGTLTVEFDFTGSTLSLLGGFVTVPPSGSFTAGTARFTVPASGPVTPTATGPRTLRSLAVTASLNFGAPQFLITGTLRLQQQGTAVASGTGTGGWFAGPSLSIRKFLEEQCTPFLSPCPPNFPILSTQNDVFDPFPFAVAGLSVNGGATVMTTRTVMFSGSTGTLVLTGVEVGRTFVPEPGRLVQLSAGLAGLVALGAWRRRRR